MLGVLKDVSYDLGCETGLHIVELGARRLQ